MIRITTNGVLNGYRADLRSSFNTLDKARETVLTQRNFNSYSEDPAAATQAFQLRRAWHRTEGQYTNSQSTIRKFNTAWNALASVEEMVDTQAGDSTLASVLYGSNSPTGSGRNALGSQLEQLAESIVQTMNAKYGDTFVFAGADELNVPFEWKEIEVTNADGTTSTTRELFYRGVNVNDGDPAVLKELAEETNYVDIGLGIKEDGQEQLIESSAFNNSLTGLSFLSYGTDGDGDPKNVACIVKRMGEILSACDANSGVWPEVDPVTGNGGEAEYRRLMGKLEAASHELKNQYVQMDTKAAFLNSNDTQLKDTANTLNEQFLDIEQCDLADAITAFSWAQYCYNAALKVGNSILSESLMDYMN